MMTNDELERLILVNLIRNPDFAKKMSPHLKPEYFPSLLGKAIVCTLFRFIRQHETIPSIQSLKALIDTNKKIGYTLRDDIIKFIDENANTKLEPNLDFLMQQAEIMAKGCRVEAAMLECVRMVENNERETFARMPKLIEEAARVSFTPVKGSGLWDDVDDLYNYFVSPSTRVPFLLDEWNRATNGGVYRGSLNNILAGSGVGKTMLMCYLAEMYLKQNLNVVYISLEMSDKEIKKRVMSNMLDIAMDEFAPDKLNKSDFFQKIDDAKLRYGNRFEAIQMPSMTTTVLEIEQYLNELVLNKGFKADVIMVDYLGITGSYMSTSQTKDYKRIELVSIELRNLAVKWDAILWSGLQVNRDGLKTNDIGAANIADSMGSYNTSDYMASVYYESDRGIFIFRQLKSRYSGRHSIPYFEVGVDYTKQRLFQLNGTASTIDKMPPPIAKTKVDTTEKVKSKVTFA